MSTISRRDVIRGLAAAGVGLAVGTATHATLVGRKALALTREDLPIDGLPSALDGLAIGFLSDLHHGPFTDRAFVDAAVTLLREADPDLVVLGGDYVTHHDRRFMTPAAEACSALAPRHGVFAVLGNHDDELEMPRALERVGVSVLQDARTSLRIRGERLDLVGTRFWTRGAGSIARLLRGAGPTPLLLAHDPRRLQEAVALGIPGMLAGHTHGGQIVLPALGALAARRFPLASGLLRRNGTSLFVTRGVGTVVLPMRLNCPPEVAVLHLRRRSTSAMGAE